MNELELKITEILGRTALDNDMQVPRKMCNGWAKATRYLGNAVEDSTLRK